MFTTNDKIENSQPTLLEYMRELGKEVQEKVRPKVRKKLPHHIQRRNLWIAEDKKEGMSLKELAAKYELKPESIKSILYQLKKSKTS